MKGTQYWGTPIWDFAIDNDAGIDQFVDGSYKAREEGQSEKASNAGNSWHSKVNFLGNFQSLLLAKDVMDRFQFCAGDYGYKLAGATKFSYWTIITAKYGYNKRHNHGGSLLSAVLYLRVPEKSGRIIFTDPRPNKSMETTLGRIGTDVSQTNIMFEPKVVLFLVFPSFLEHEVDMTMSDSDRIIASFNLSPATMV